MAGVADPAGGDPKMIRPPSTVAALLTIPVLCLAAAGCAISVDTGAAAEPGGSSDFAASVDVGSIDFPTSAGEEAQEHFVRGVAILHSFGYEQAREQFHAAQELEPDFALAYWGETLTYNHPLLPERDLESPREALVRLGETREERAAKAATERELGFLAAVEELFGEGELAQRRIGYMEAMRSLYESHPDDDEVAAFYALSLLSAVGPLRDDTFRLNVMAGSIGLELFERNPNHPGAAHYIIHSFDDPVHAPLALPAAHRFAEIAAAVSHARHMPSHIFIQRGMWNLVSKSNDSAYEAAVALWNPGVRVGDMVHALDWGQYGDLQRGDYAKARKWIVELDDLVERTEDTGRGMSTVPLVRARYIVETEQWEDARDHRRHGDCGVAGDRDRCGPWWRPGPGRGGRCAAQEGRRAREWRPLDLPARKQACPGHVPRGRRPDPVGRRRRGRGGQAVRRGLGRSLDDGTAAGSGVADQAHPRVVR